MPGDTYAHAPPRVYHLTGDLLRLLAHLLLLNFWLLYWQALRISSLRRRRYAVYTKLRREVAIATAAVGAHRAIARLNKDGNLHGIRSKLR